MLICTSLSSHVWSACARGMQPRPTASVSPAVRDRTHLALWTAAVPRRTRCASLAVRVLRRMQGMPRERNRRPAAPGCRQARTADQGNHQQQAEKFRPFCCARILSAPPADRQTPSLRDEHCLACLVIASAGNLAGRLASPPQTAATARAPKRTNTTCPPALSTAHCRLHRPPHTYIVLPALRGVEMRVHDPPKKSSQFLCFFHEEGGEMGTSPV